MTFTAESSSVRVVETTRGWTRNALRKAYSQYATAMRRKRAGSELCFFRFCCYLEQQNVRVFRHNGSYIFGQLGGGIFKVSHFAPATMRGGVEAVKALLESEQACVLALPTEMAAMLERLGYEAEGTMETNFRGEDMTKHVISNNQALQMELREKLYAIKIGQRTLESFERLMNVASLCWAEARYGYVYE